MLQFYLSYECFVFSAGSNWEPVEGAEKGGNMRKFGLIEDVPRHFGSIGGA